MCGIISIFSDEKAFNHNMEKLITNMLWIDTIRGDHSTGLLYEGLDGPEMFKRAMPGTDFVQLQRTRAILRDIEKTPYLVGHNRAATRGALTTDNAHPFQFDHITGVHNGTLTSYHNLSPVGASHQVDSQHLYHGIAEEGAAAIIPQLQGAFNLIWHDASDNTMHLCKNGDRPYTFAKVKGKDTLIGASEKLMLKWLMNRHLQDIEYCWQPKEHMEYVWTVEDDMVIPSSTIQHEEYIAPVRQTYNQQRVHETNNPSGGSLMLGEAGRNASCGRDKSAAGGPNKDASNTTTIEMVEFFIDSFVYNTHLSNGARTCTCYGETVNGEEVIMFHVPEGKVTSDEWYIGRGFFVRSVGSDYWQINVEGVKLHPLENPEQALQICSNCGEDHAENDGVTCDQAPLCLKCCDMLQVRPDQVTPGEEWKLMAH